MVYAIANMDMEDTIQSNLVAIQSAASLKGYGVFKRKISKYIDKALLLSELSIVLIGWLRHFSGNGSFTSYSKAIGCKAWLQNLILTETLQQ